MIQEHVPLTKEDFAKPPPRPDTNELRNLSYKERLRRRLKMADMALEKYEVKLEKFHASQNPNDALTSEEERIFLLHQDSVRKLEATLAQLERQSTEEDQTDLDTALALYDTGITIEFVAEQMSYNPGIEKLLREAITARKKANE
jgi:hypothetical protein